MTEDQIDQLKILIHAVQKVVDNAKEAYIPYELGAAISRADDAQSECYQFVHALQHTEPQPK